MENTNFLANETTEEFIQRLKDEYQRNFNVIINQPPPKVKARILNIIKVCCYIRDRMNDDGVLTQNEKMKE